MRGMTKRIWLPLPNGTYHTDGPELIKVHDATLSIYSDGSPVSADLEQGYAYCQLVTVEPVGMTQPATEAGVLVSKERIGRDMHNCHTPRGYYKEDERYIEVLQATGLAEMYCNIYERDRATLLAAHQQLEARLAAVTKELAEAKALIKEISTPSRPRSYWDDKRG